MQIFLNGQIDALEEKPTFVLFPGKFAAQLRGVQSDLYPQTQEGRYRSYFQMRRKALVQRCLRRFVFPVGMRECSRICGTYANLKYNARSESESLVSFQGLQ